MAKSRIQEDSKRCEDCGGVCDVTRTSSQWIYQYRCRSCKAGGTIAWATREEAPTFAREEAPICQHIEDRIVTIGSYTAKLSDGCVALAQFPSLYCAVHRRFDDTPDTPTPDTPRKRKPRRDRTLDVLPWSQEDQDIFAAHRSRPARGWYSDQEAKNGSEVQ